MITSSCLQSPRQYLDEQLIADEWLKKKAILSNDFFAIHRLPNGYNADRLLLQATQLAASIREWLGLPAPSTPLKIFIFSAEEPLGNYILGQSRTRHRATGFYNPEKQMVVVAGEQEDPRFWTVLNHEIGHAVLYSGLPVNVKPPFWFSEGVATLFEGGTENHQPRIDDERLRYMLYHLDKNRPLDLKRLILLSKSSMNSNSNYARAWAVTAYIYFCDLPVRSYMKNFTEADVSDLVIFKRFFLSPHETLDDFSSSCIRWVLAQKK